MFNKYPKLPNSIQQSIKEIFQKYSLPRWMVFTFDTLSAFLVMCIAYLLRFNFHITDYLLTYLLPHAVLATCSYAIFALIFRSYSGLIRHTTIIDIFTVILANSFALTTLVVITLVGRLIGYTIFLRVPISILLIHYGSLTLFLMLTRIGIKFLYLLIKSSFIQRKKVLIFGAGEMGVIVKRVIQSDIKSNYQIAGFLDHNKSLQGKKLNGFPVYNPSAISSKFLQQNDIQTLIFAVKEISSEQKSKIIRFALDNGLEILQTPAVDKWLNGQLQMSQIKKVKLKDLLGRETIKLNLEKIASGLEGKTILISGAAGSIGSEIVRQLARFKVKKLILVDQAETPMYKITNEIRDRFEVQSMKAVLADVTLKDKIENVFKEFKPEIVFHAAAYKHVPLMEENPHEAVRVNMAGTINITDLSVKYGVQKFVMISTDKAVNPANVMGASKRACEMIVQIKAHQQGNKTQFVITRFGNVLGSNGSVIPIFRKQIEEGGPVTVTHPEITRFFMTIPEACQLVLEAGFMGKGDEIYVFDMGKPVKIAHLAAQMIRLSGLVPDKDIRIMYTGLRPGEKLYEELLTNRENCIPTHHPKIKIAKVEKFNIDLMQKKIETLLKDLYNLSDKKVIEALKVLVPEYDKTVKNNGIHAGKKSIEMDSTV